MATLSSELRNKLERVVVDARDVAEVGARAALEALAVHHHEPYSHMKPPQRELRNHLRARARQLGDGQDRSGRLAINHLAGECAYEHWHRMLFARFLAENGLLIEPEMGVAISLAEAEELAKEDGVDVWVFASRCAERMLPQIFRPEDPLLQVSYAAEHMLKLERLLASLPHEVFTASDALGWVYQFWQSKKKDEVNRSEVKIGADEISAVTQLFTEPYMVEFLLHNTLGAWWAGKKASSYQQSAASEDECRRAVGLPGLSWDYLRFVKGEDGEDGAWRPAAGTFDGWPKTAAELKVLDPCCGSGHFLVAALHHLVPIRMAEESLSACDAVDAVLRDNLHGLEIDDRCCQIAAFALAFTAWTYPGAGGYRPLPKLHIACTGIGPQSTAEEWVKLAEESGIPIPALGHEPIKAGLLNLHRLFSQAPTLGSLINPAELPVDMFVADFETIQPYLAAILQAEKADDETRERAIAAAGMVEAADLLAHDYTLIITNVPYLGRGRQDDTLRAHIEKHFGDGKADLATAFELRIIGLCSKAGTAAMVTPQNWLFLATYKKLRSYLLKNISWNVVARLGPRAFETITGEVVNVALLAVSETRPDTTHTLLGLDATEAKTPAEKAESLRNVDVRALSQSGQLANPDNRIVLEETGSGELLANFADSFLGLGTGDYLHYGRCFWEFSHKTGDWAFQQASVKQHIHYGGREHVVFWDNSNQRVRGMSRAEREQIHNQDQSGQQAWGREGVCVSLNKELPVTCFSGELFDKAVAVLVPRRRELLLPVHVFAESTQFQAGVRALDQKTIVANGTLLKVPFDLSHWQKVARERYPEGLPEPESDDPTQWLFHGWPEESTAPLQVAVARLLSYQWPAEIDSNMRLSERTRNLVERCSELVKCADFDGIVCMPSIRGEDAAVERLQTLLAECGIEPSGNLDEWLRGDFFENHCKLFHNRPFIWHVWDGRKRDGFHALVNYHKLCEGNGKGRKLLESLTYSYLGDWITRQKDGVSRREGGAEDRLAAALELQKRLEAILEGEPPFDLFVRWKPISEQAIGWDPDINDGVRMNIRPFLASDLPGGKKGAGILRYKPNISWKKDRGREPVRAKDEYPWFWSWDQKSADFAGGKAFDGTRWNDCHYTNKYKQAARKAEQGVTDANR